MILIAYREKSKQTEAKDSIPSQIHTTTYKH
jgi:hypothetical protein